MRFRSVVVAAAATLVFGASTTLAQTPVSTTAADVDRRVDALLTRMTLEEKIDLLGGVDGFFTHDVPRLGIPRLKMADGPLGVRNFGPATAMAAGISLAATWNPQLAESVGAAIGRDARAKGVHFLLGPGVNIYRAPMNGRNFEYYGEDPFLASRVAVGYINGVQAQGVSATIKHFMGNNSEFDRHNTNSVIDERTLREIYLPVFEAAVTEAHVGAIMDAYNLTNGAHMTQNGYLNTDVVKKQWGFDGIVMSDWVATYDGVAAANGGLDLEMPSGEFLNRAKLLPAIQQRQVTVPTIDDKVRRLLRIAVRFGWFDRDQTDLSIPRYNPQSRDVALQAAREGMVLLKNDGNLLPLKKDSTRTIAVIGPDAYPAVPVGGGSAAVHPFAAVSFLEGVSDYLGDPARVYYARGIPSLGDMAEQTRFSTAASGGEPGLRAEYFTNTDLQGTPAVTRVDQHVNIALAGAVRPAGTRSSRWTGFYTPAAAGAHEVFVHTSGEGGAAWRLLVDDKPLLERSAMNTALAYTVTLPLDARAHKVVLEERAPADRGLGRLRLGIVSQAHVVEESAKALAAKADAVVIAVGFDPDTESEGADRTFQLPPGQDELIQQVNAVNKNAIVVITSGGAVDMNSWLASTRAVVEAWYPGQEGGRALAELLFGDADFSGRLPVSFERRWEDNPVHDSYYPEPGTNRITYKEGLFVGYRGYERAGTAPPLFSFGFGLSYTSFRYSNLAIRSAAAGHEVSFDLTNTGLRAGSEVAQVYIGASTIRAPRPAKELKGFVKVTLQPGETRHVSVILGPRSFANYDPAAQQWHVDPGDREVLVGRSSQQIELGGKVTLK